MAEIREIVTRYMVTAWPEDMADCLDAYLWSVTVEDRGHGKWAVMHLSECLGSDGEWDYEPSPSNREDRWLETHRFDLEEALTLAREWAPKVTINGKSALECAEWHRQREVAR